MKGMLLIFAFLLIALTARNAYLHSDSHLAAKKHALEILGSVPELHGVSIRTEECEYIEMNSVTALNCQFSSFFTELNGNVRESGWVYVSQIKGEDPWRRNVERRSFRSGSWVVILYKSSPGQLAGASLILSPA